MAMPRNEAFVPDLFSACTDGYNKQLHVLDNFSIHKAGVQQDLCSLDELPSSRPVASGELLPANSAAGADASRQPITTGPVLDWCLEYGDNPAVWIITQATWYNLKSPSATYASTYKHVRVKQELAVKCAAFLASQPDATLEQVQQHLSTAEAGSKDKSSSKEDAGQQLQAQAAFLAGQMAALQKAGNLPQQQPKQQQAPPGNQHLSMPFLQWLQQQAAQQKALKQPKRRQSPTQAAAGAGAAADTEAAQPAKRQRVQPSGAGAATARTTQEDAAGAATPSAVSSPAAPPAAAGGSGPIAAKLSLKVKINLGAGAGAAAGPAAKPKIKLKGQILPQAQPPPQDTGSQIQGHPPGFARQQTARQGREASTDHSQGQQQQQQSKRPLVFKPKIKLLMPKGGLRSAGPATAGNQQQPHPSPAVADQLQGQGSLAVSDGIKASLISPAQPQHPQQQQHPGWDQEWEQQAALYSQSQPVTARQQQRAAAAAAKQAAAAAKAAAAAARAEEAARKRQQKLLEQQMKQQAELAADVARGPPPAPTRSFRLPGHMVVEVLMLWELCQSFGTALQLPPFSSEMLEAALLPGPLTDEQKEAASAAAQQADAAAEAERVALAEATKAAAAAAAAAVGEATQAAKQPVESDKAAGAADINTETFAAAVKAVCNGLGADHAAFSPTALPNPGADGTAAASCAQVVALQGADIAPVVKVEHVKRDEPGQQQLQLVKPEQDRLLQQGQQPEHDTQQPVGDEKQKTLQPWKQYPAQGAAGQPPQQTESQRQQPQQLKQEQNAEQPLQQLRVEQRANQQPAADAVKQGLGTPDEQQMPAGAVRPEETVGAILQQADVSRQQQHEPQQLEQLRQQQLQKQQFQPQLDEMQPDQLERQPQRQPLEQEQEQQQLKQQQQQQSASLQQVEQQQAQQQQHELPAVQAERQEQQQGQSLQAASEQQVVDQNTEQQQQPRQLQPLEQQQQQPLQRSQDTGLPPKCPPRTGSMAAPAPSTSVGTVTQTAMSGSIGGTGHSPEKKLLKLKVKLGGSQRQQGTNTAAAAHGGVVENVALAAGTPVDGMSGSNAAVAAGVAATAAGWQHNSMALWGPQPSIAADVLTVRATKAAAAAAAAADEAEAQQQPDVGITDWLHLPSSVLLRDIHNALLKLVDGTGNKPGRKPQRQPAVARLCPSDSQKQLTAMREAPHWSQRMAEVLTAAGLGAAAAEQNIVQQLLKADYVLLPLEVRFAALRYLSELAAGSEGLHQFLDARGEPLKLPKGEPHRSYSFGYGARGLGSSRCFSGSNVGPDGPSKDEKQAALEAAEYSTASKMVEEWMDWLAQVDQQSLGLRRPLGMDFRQRHYWLFGGAAGAWRVYCEEQQGRLWGYYEGEQLLQLVQWLACAGLEHEAPLLYFLTTIPWPYRPSLVLMTASSAATAAAAAAGAEPPDSPGSIAYWAAVATGGMQDSYASSKGYGAYNSNNPFTPSQAGVLPLGSAVIPGGMRLPAASQLMSPAEMQRHRPNGYRGLVGPMLFGEAGVPGGSILADAESRLRAGLFSLAGVIPFWLHETTHLLQELGQVLDKLQVAYTPGEFSELLLSLESLIAGSPVTPSLLDASWRELWQSRWRDSLQSTGPASWESVALHCAMLGRHVMPNKWNMGQDAFRRMVATSRCPLLFPQLGEEYMLLRSGCLTHLDKYKKLPDNATEPLPPPAAELTAVAELLKQLPSASKCRVAGVACMSYPMPPAPIPQQALAPKHARGSANAGDTATAAAGAGKRDGIGADGATGRQGGLLDEHGLSNLADLDNLNDFDSDFGFDSDLESPRHSHKQQQQQQHELQDALGERQAAAGQQQQHQQVKRLQVPGSPQPSQQQQNAAVAADGTSGTADAGQAQQQQQPLAARSPVPEFRPPCMWLLLSPVSSISASFPITGAAVQQQQQHLWPRQQDLLQQQHQQGAVSSNSSTPQRPYVAVPIHVDAELSDYLVPIDVYEVALQKRWLPGDRFSMLCKRQQGERIAGSYYNGSILSVEEALHGLEYDPWQSINVMWEDADDANQHKVSPWEIETDRDEARKAAEEARKQQAAAAAAEELHRQEAAAAEAKQKRRANRTIQDYSGLVGAVDDDDEYNPLADGYSSDSDNEGRRRKRKGDRDDKGLKGAVWGPGGSGDNIHKRKRGHADDDAEYNGMAADVKRGVVGGKAGSKAAGGVARYLAGLGGVGEPGTPWSLAQIQQQQQVNLVDRQKLLLQAMMAGNAALVQQLSRAPPGMPIQDQPLPAPLKADLLASLPCKDGFTSLITDYNGCGRFSIPLWGNRQLDLYTLFLVVNVRGGYEAVCRTNRWQDVCRSLGCDQGPASGSSMRTNYERCLVEFEQYLRSGRYQQDKVSGQLPGKIQADTAAAMEQVKRAGAAADAPPIPVNSGPRPSSGPAGSAAVSRGPQLVAGAGHAGAGLIALPGVAGVQGIQLAQQGGATVLGTNAAGHVVISATPQQLQAIQLQLRIQQQQQAQQQLLLAQQGKAGAAGPVILPAGAANQQQLQQQLLLRQQLIQQAQLQAAAAGGNAQAVQAAAAANPQLQALLQQQQTLQRLQQLQQQQQSGAAARPAAAANALGGLQLPAGITLQQLQALQQAQQAQKAAVGAGAGQAQAALSLPLAAVGPASSAIMASVAATSSALPAGAAVAGPLAPAAAGAAGSGPPSQQRTASQALAGMGSLNFSALLDDL